VQDTYSSIIQGDPSDIPTMLEELNAAAAEAMAEME
jgi:hypothetical protein